MKGRRRRRQGANKAPGRGATKREKHGGAETQRQAGRKEDGARAAAAKQSMPPLSRTLLPAPVARPQFSFAAVWRRRVAFGNCTSTCRGGGLSITRNKTNERNRKQEGVGKPAVADDRRRGRGPARKGEERSGVAPAHHLKNTINAHEERKALVLAWSCVFLFFFLCTRRPARSQAGAYFESSLHAGLLSYSPFSGHALALVLRQPDGIHAPTDCCFGFELKSCINKRTGRGVKGGSLPQQPLGRHYSKKTQPQQTKAKRAPPHPHPNPPLTARPPSPPPSPAPPPWPAHSPRAGSSRSRGAESTSSS